MYISILRLKIGTFCELATDPKEKKIVGKKIVLT